MNPGLKQFCPFIHDPSGLRIADVGCGGGIYARAWCALGAREVIGVDRSPTMISAATELGRRFCGRSRGVFRRHVGPGRRDAH